jgi:hypothetical protein
VLIRKALGLRQPVQRVDVYDHKGHVGEIRILTTALRLARRPGTMYTGKFFSVVAVPWRGKYAHWYVADLDEAHRTLPEAEAYIRGIVR